MTDATIKTLRTEAGSAGDTQTVRDCEAALRGSRAARRRLAKLVADAAAMDND